MFKIILLLWSTSLFQISVVFGEDQLLSVVALFRHGESTPTYFSPTDKYKDPAYWETKYGELTKFGKEEHSWLGQFLKDRYEKFLPEQYNENDVYVRSANIDRCLKSAEANLAKLYPSSYKTIVVHTVPMQNDSVIEMEKACPKYQEIFVKIAGDQNDKWSQQFKEIISFLSEKLGENITSIFNMTAPYETMTTEVKYNMVQPDWTNKIINDIRIFPEQMKIFSDNSYTIPVITSDLARLATGRFYDTIGSHFEAVASNKQENKIANKMVMFFGYKQTITNVMGTLRADFDDALKSSTLLFELWRNNTDQINYLKAYYVIDQKLSDFQMIRCSDKICSLPQFLETIADKRMNKTAFDKDCLGIGGSPTVSGSILVAVIVSLSLIFNSL